MTTHGDLGLEVDNLLFLANSCFLFVILIRDIHFDAQRITEPVNANTIGTNNATNVFTIDNERS
jgi:hypothetical protein